MQLQHRAFIALIGWMLIAGSVLAQLPSGNPSGVSEAFSTGTTAYFHADGGIWSTDGTPEGTRQLAEKAGNRLALPLELNGTVYYFQHSPCELYAWIASENRQQLVWREYGCVVDDALVFQGRILFLTAHGRFDEGAYSSVWSTDGTAVTRLGWFRGSSLLDGLAVLGKYVYFDTRVPGDETTTPYRLWRTDGSAEGSIELMKGTEPLVPSASAVGDVVLFEQSRTLWRTDGTVEGTEALDYEAVDIASHGRTGWFINGAGLWQTDGTRAGTVRVGDGEPEAILETDETGRLFLFAQWPQETRLSTLENGVRSVAFPVPARRWTYSPRPALAAGRVLYLQMRSSEHGYELWRTDGTPEGTRLVRDVAPGPRNSGGLPLVIVNQKILFGADEGLHGLEPWVTDGTEQGTRLLKNIAPEGHLRGRVVDRDSGEPVAGAVIEVWWSYGFLGEFAANADGTFDRPIWTGEYKLRAQVPTHVKQLWKERDCPDCPIDKGTVVKVAAGKDAEVEFRLRRGGTIRGRVVDAAGNPEAGVKVAAGHRYDDYGPAAEVRTASDGTYALAVPPGNWLVYIPEDWDVPAERRWAPVIYPGLGCTGGCGTSIPFALRLSPDAGETLDGIDFVVRPLGKVRVRLIDTRTGAPPSQVMRVEFYYEGQVNLEVAAETVWTNDTAEVSLPDNRYHVLAVQRFQGEPFGSAWYPNIPCDSCNRLQGELVTPVAGETVEITIYVSPNGPQRRRAAR